MRDRLKNTDLFIGAQGGYHTNTTNPWNQLSARDKLKQFGAGRVQTPYGGMYRRGGR